MIQLKEVEIYPVDMGFGRSRSQRGRPMLAHRELARTILDQLARVSASCGTQIEMIDGRGVIRVS